MLYFAGELGTSISLSLFLSGARSFPSTPGHIRLDDTTLTSNSTSTSTRSCHTSLDPY